MADSSSRRWTIWQVIKQTFTEFGEDKCPRLGAALAYYTIFSIAPLLVIAVGLFGWISGTHNTDPNKSRVVQQVTNLVGGEGGEAIKHMVAATLKQPHKGAFATIIGIIVLLFGATGVFGALQDALNTIWEVAPKPGRGIWMFVRERFLSFAMVAGICFLLLVSLVISAGLKAIEDTVGGGSSGFMSYFWRLVDFGVSIGVVSVLFAMMFKVLPDVKMKWRGTWIGAIATAILFGIGKWAIGEYLGRAGVGSTYGAVGSAVVLLLWVYYSSQIFLVGAEFTQVYACHIGSKYVPASNAISLTEMQRIQEGIPHNKVLTAAASRSSATHPDRTSHRSPTHETEKPSRLLPATLAFAAGFVAGKSRRGPKAKKLVRARGVRLVRRPTKPEPHEDVWHQFKKGFHHGVEEAR
jgi:membrane protein